MSAHREARPARQRLYRRERLATRREFQRVLESGASLFARGIRFRFAPNDLGWSRLGMTVSRRAGGAVERNRIRRLLREGFRLAKADLPAPVDIVASPPAGDDLTFERVRAAYAKLAATLARPGGQP